MEIAGDISETYKAWYREVHDERMCDALYLFLCQDELCARSFAFPLSCEAIAAYGEVKMLPIRSWYFLNTHHEI